MKNHWRKLTSLFPLQVEKSIYKLHFKSLHQQWVKGKKEFPPSHFVKQQTIKKYAEENNLSVLVETGTYLGDMIFAMQDHFKQIFSIELSPLFYQKAVARFKNFKKIKIFEGDSGKVLKELVPTLKTPALFWLDGHYSGGQTAKGDKECPVFEELQNILNSTVDHTIIIDDARLFVGKNDYPAVKDLKGFVLRLKPKSRFTLQNDAIIITPK